MFHELILLRHAKSAWPVGIRDAQRPLSARGRRNAARFGNVLGSDGVNPEVVIVSPATRTRETWDLVCGQSGIDPGIASFDDRLYAATWWDVLDVVRGIPADCARALVIGHNPAMEDLAGQLADDHSDAQALRELRAKFPTCAAAWIQSDEEWARWGGQCGSLTQFWKPRQHGSR